jgi:hypothetical protein
LIPSSANQCAGSSSSAYPTAGKYPSMKIIKGVTTHNGLLPSFRLWF